MTMPEGSDWVEPVAGSEMPSLAPRAAATMWLRVAAPATAKAGQSMR
jgi:hypothetical protein